MDRIKDAHIVRLIEQISDHYRNNITNRFLRPVLLQLPIDKTTWDHIELLTEKLDLFQYQGFHLDDLYRQIAACAMFVDVARSNLMPTLKAKLSAFPGSQDKILREMAASNFESNLKVFADLLNALYAGLVEIDKTKAVKNQPVYTQMIELHSIDRLLTGI